jgi:hypothetical protein
MAKYDPASLGNTGKNPVTPPATTYLAGLPAAPDPHGVHQVSSIDPSTLVNSATNQSSAAGVAAGAAAFADGNQELVHLDKNGNVTS